MVRVISSGFSTPRSRHSSSEDMVDRLAAMKAVSALGAQRPFCLYGQDEDSLDSRALVVASCDTDTSSDSYSGADSEQDGPAAAHSGASSDGQNLPVTKKKQRRRERNKVSAQHYRQRRRAQGDAAQKTLQSLESRHKVLLEQVRHMEAEKHIVKEYLKSCVKIPWCPYQHPCEPNNCHNPNPQTVPTRMPIENAPVMSMPLSMLGEGTMPVRMCCTSPLESSGRSPS